MRAVGESAEGERLHEQRESGREAGPRTQYPERTPMTINSRTSC